MLPVRFSKMREAKGLTQAQLAEILNMSVRAITAWEAGDRKPPIDKLEWLADFYGVTTDYLLGRTDIPNVYVHDGIKLPDGREGILYSTQKDLPPEDQEQVQALAQRAQDEGQPGVTLPGGFPIPEELQRFVEQAVEQYLARRDEQSNDQ